MGGQEQFYFEPMVTLAVPNGNLNENWLISSSEDDIILYCSTQNANKTQKIVASVLGKAMHQVTCKVARIGGGFGGKETRNINISAAAGNYLRNLLLIIKLWQLINSIYL